MLLLLATACAPTPRPATARDIVAPPRSSAPPGHIHEEPPTDGAAAPPSSTATRPPPVESSVSQPAASDDRAAYERARPVFERFCASCHTTAGDRSRAASLRHFNMDAYPLGGHHADEIGATIRKVLGATGQRATMPRDEPGAIQGAELRLVLDWADAFDRAHPARPAHHHGGHKH